MKFKVLTILMSVLFTSFSPLPAGLWVDTSRLLQLAEDNHWEVVEINPPEVGDLSCSLSISDGNFNWSSRDMDIHVHVTAVGQCPKFNTHSRLTIQLPSGEVVRGQAYYSDLLGRGMGERSMIGNDIEEYRVFTVKYKYAEKILTAPWFVLHLEGENYPIRAVIRSQPY